MATPNPRKASPARKGQKATGPARPAKAGKSSATKPTGFMNWLGRQVGHVKKAVRTDVTRGPAKPPEGAKPAGPKSAGPAPSPRPATAGPSATSSAASKVVYRNDKIEEVEHPTQPGVILRRTIVDEVIVEGEVVEKKGEE
jgi:hypothetical protein